jgi:hypothetical protein
MPEISRRNQVGKFQTAWFDCCQFGGPDYVDVVKVMASSKCLEALGKLRQFCRRIPCSCRYVSGNGTDVLLDRIVLRVLANL